MGYHVGQDRVANHDTGLIFATAGILLEELKVHGLEALTKYKVVMIDECHERSCESDLCLTIIKEFMIAYPRSKLRLVLMSATFNHAQYKAFFQRVPGCEYVDTITLQTAQSINAFYTNVQMFYLEDVAKMIQRSTQTKKSWGDDSDSEDEGVKAIDFCNKMKSDPDNELKGFDNGRTLSHRMLACIGLLVDVLDEEESHDGIFLIFAPTYRHLEEIYDELASHDRYDLGVLHSSIDMEDCLKAMKIMENNGMNGKKLQRKILIASAIADSSVTIPNVTCVIDTCRSLKVKWDSERSKHNAKTVWSSQAICDQRRGRTGRTCEGRVFRLVHQGFYNNSFEPWEQAQLELASCRDEVISLLSSHNKVMSDPQALLQKCLDPPPINSVTKAIQYLVDIGACVIESSSRRQKLIPTDHGRLISALPFTVEEVGVIVHGAKHGFLHEAIALVAIKSIRPQPIVSAFGDDFSNQLNLRRYYPSVDVKDPMSVVVAHLAAYIFWHVKWNNVRDHAMKEHFEKFSGANNHPDASHLFGKQSIPHKRALDCNVGMWTSEMDKVHSDWCREHFINASSVKALSQYSDVAMKTLFRCDFEPEWLKCQPLEPTWKRDRVIKMQQNDVYSSVYGLVKGPDISSESLITLQQQGLAQRKNRVKDTDYACIHFLNGNCLYGDSCNNAHSFDAPRPLCRFYFRPGGCTNRSCAYSHKQEAVDETDNDAMITPTFGRFTGGPVKWYRQSATSLLLFGGRDILATLSFGLRAPPAITSTGDANGHGCPLGLSATRFHENHNLKKHFMNSQITKLAWNFPCVSADATDEENELLLRGFFMSAAAYFSSKLGVVGNFEVGIALQGNQFSKCNVLKAAQHSGFCLEWSDHFDCSAFPNFKPCYSSNESMNVHNARFYVFQLKKLQMLDPISPMIDLKYGAMFGIELEMSLAGHYPTSHIAMELQKAGIRVDIIRRFSEGKRTSRHWKIVEDASLVCNRSAPDCNKFELVSPILQSEDGLTNAANLLRHLSNFKPKLNKSMGFHVHVDVSKYNAKQLSAICQQLIRYEDAIDCIMPPSRRTGSDNSNRFFMSNGGVAKSNFGITESSLITKLGRCKTIRELAGIMNFGDTRYYKFNLQNLKNGRQPTIEFRQHSSTADHEKVGAWVRFCIRFCENAANLEHFIPDFDDELLSIDVKFDYLFKNLIRDVALFEFYRKRRALLTVDEEGDGCCYDCALGRGCKGVSFLPDELQHQVRVQS